MQEDILCLFALKLIQINQFKDVLDEVWFAVGWKSLHGISAGDDIIVWRVLWIDNSDSNWREAQRSDGKPSVWGESTGGKKQSDRFTVQPVLRRDAWNEHATHATTHPDAIYLPADGSMCVCVCVDDEQVPFACPCAYWCHLTSNGSSDMDHMSLWRATRRVHIAVSPQTHLLIWVFERENPQLSQRSREFKLAANFSPSQLRK